MTHTEAIATLRAALEYYADPRHNTPGGRARDALAATANLAPSEPAEYQYRTRAGWHKHWSEWEKCSPKAAGDYIKVPLLHDWHYEVRKLYTEPQAVPVIEPACDDPRIKAAMFDSLLHVAECSGFATVGEAVHAGIESRAAPVVAVPEGWTIKRREDGRIAVVKEGYGGSYVADDPRFVTPETTLYFLAEDMLAAAPAAPLNTAAPGDAPRQAEI